MDAPSFDTAKFQETLSEGGFSSTQAKSLTRAVADATVHLPSVDGLTAFKADLRADMAAIRVDLAELRSELKAEVAQLRADVFKALGEQARWTATLVFGAVLLNAAVVAGVGLALYNALKS